MAEQQKRQWPELVGKVKTFTFLKHVKSLFSNRASGIFKNSWQEK